MTERYPSIVHIPKAQPSDPRRQVRVLELQHLARKRQKRSRLKWKIGHTVMRDPSKVDGIVMHQAAVQWGSRPSHKKQAAAMLKAEGLDPEENLAQWERLALALRVVEDVPAHATAMQSGDVVLRSPLEAFLYHANALNKRSLGLEIEGLYDGVEVAGAHPEPTPVTIAAARRAVRELYERGIEAGMPIKYLWAHRQSSGTRRADPGSMLWLEVGVWASKELGLEIQPMETWLSLKSGRGKPIPESWGGQEGVRY
jgi:hypothetical protein